MRNGIVIYLLFQNLKFDGFSFDISSKLERLNMKNKLISIEYIKSLGANKSEENLDYLLGLFQNTTLDVDTRREIVSSIGRQDNNTKILDFIQNNVFSCGCMDFVYQMYRTCLYKNKSEDFKLLGDRYYNILITKC